MYIGSTGPAGLHHLVWEVVDNSVDEAMAGFCTRIDVSLRNDGSCRVIDDGRGIPVDEHPQYKGKSAAEIALTMLHAGGKFGGGGYKVSGGLHGVGISVVNALSTKLHLEIDRDEQRYEITFTDGGKPQGKLKVTGPAPRGRTGTTVTFTPDPSIFEEVEFRAQRTAIDRSPASVPFGPVEGHSDPQNRAHIPARCRAALPSIHSQKAALYEHCRLVWTW
jgi:DNA gyrase subunit B